MSKQEQETRLVRRFTVADASGATHALEEWGLFKRYLSLDGWSEWVHVGGQIRLGSRYVNETDDPAVFEMADTGERLTAVPPGP